MNVTEHLDTTRRTRAAIEALIAEPARLGPDFAPIVPLDPGGTADAAPLGFKATGRGLPGTEVGDTLSLLEGAQSLGLVERLDWAFRCHAFDVALAAGLVGELHLTPEPETFGSPCPPRLARSWSRGRQVLSVVAELHDDAFADPDRLRAAVAEMRGWGWRLAVADQASDPAVRDALEWLRPDYVELDARQPTRVDSDVVREWLAAAATLSATVLAVGVDSAASRQAALRAGATCGRGSLLGQPGDLPPG